MWSVADARDAASPHHVRVTRHGSIVVDGAPSLASHLRGKLTPPPRRRRFIASVVEPSSITSLANDMAMDGLMRDACAELGLRPWTAAPGARPSPPVGTTNAAKDAEWARTRTSMRARHNFDASPRANLLLENARLRETNAQLEDANATLIQQRDELDISFRVTLEEHDELKRALFDDMVELIVELEGAHALVAELDTRLANLIVGDGEVATAAANATREATPAAATAAATAAAAATATASGAKAMSLPLSDEGQFAAFLEEQFLLARDAAEEGEPAVDVSTTKAVTAGGAAVTDNAAPVAASPALLRREQTRADLEALQHSFSSIGAGAEEYAQMRALCFPRAAAPASPGSKGALPSSAESLSCAAFKHAFRAFLAARHADAAVADATIDAIFAAIDVDCDGVLSQCELLCGLVSLFKLDPIVGASAMFHACDTLRSPLPAGDGAGDGLLQLGEFSIAFRSIMAVAALRHPEHFAHVDSAREVGTAHARVMFAAILGGRCAGSSDGITKAQFIAWFVACVSCDQDWEQGEQSVEEIVCAPRSAPISWFRFLDADKGTKKSEPRGCRRTGCYKFSSAGTRHYRRVETDNPFRRSDHECESHVKEIAPSLIVHLLRNYVQSSALDELSSVMCLP